jgi:hypothetical protein
MNFLVEGGVSAQQEGNLGSPKKLKYFFQILEKVFTSKKSLKAFKS